jgi:hypothetical protein
MIAFQQPEDSADALSRRDDHLAVATIPFEVSLASIAGRRAR